MAIDPRGHLAGYCPCWVGVLTFVVRGDIRVAGFRVDYVQDGEHKTDYISRDSVASLRYYG